MAHREVYARVITPLYLPDGCSLHPGQSIEPFEISVLGAERLGDLLGSGAVELRSRQVADATGILTSFALKDAIERGRGELAALDRALTGVTGGAGVAASGTAASPPREDGSRRPPPSADCARAVARSLLTLTEAHSHLRRELEALAAALSANRPPE